MITQKKHLIGKLVLECEDEILNTTEIPLEDKKITCKKYYASYTIYYVLFKCLVYTISLVITCLLLLIVICVSCFYYT